MSRALPYCPILGTLSPNDASSSPATSAKGVRWDLSELFSGVDDPGIEKTLDACRADADAFAEKYRGTIETDGGPTPKHLMEALKSIEVLLERLGKVGSFAGLMYSADTADEQVRNLQQTV